MIRGPAGFWWREQKTFVLEKRLGYCTCGVFHVYVMSTRPVNLLCGLGCLYFEDTELRWAQCVAQPCTSLWALHAREREKERCHQNKRLSPQQERIFLQAEHENAASPQHRWDLQAGCACMPRLKGSLDPPAQHATEFERAFAEVPVTVTVPL